MTAIRKTHVFQWMVGLEPGTQSRPGAATNQPYKPGELNPSPVHLNLFSREREQCG